MGDPKQDLLKQMAALRGKLNPEVVRRLDLAREGKVPYDRDSAHEAVRQFLAIRQGNPGFTAKLMAALKKAKD